MKTEAHEIVVAGGGPTGLMLAAELALAKVDVVVVERRANQDVAGSRASGLHARTLEVLDQRGVVDRFLAQGKIGRMIPAFGGMFDIADLATRHNYTLALFQEKIERTLAEWALELGVTIAYATEVTGFAQDEGGVDVDLSDGRKLRAKYLVGCDGGRSVVRKKAGIDFVGWDPTTSYLIAETDFADEPAWGIRHAERGINALAKLDDGKRVRMVLVEPHLEKADDPTPDDLKVALVALYGTDFGIHNVTFLSRFTDMARQATKYRDRRILLAGDAAHVHSPSGGQGLQVGVQDAVNLGWKLAQVVRGISSDDLLDTYEAERHPVAARVLKMTLALTAVHRGDERTEALREMLTEVMSGDEARTRYAARLLALDLRYDLGDGHPLVGRRMPDLDLTTANGTERVFSLLHAARPLFVNLGERGAHDISAWKDGVRRIDAEYTGSWQLPGLGEIPAPTAVLVRPDGYVAWASSGNEDGLREALTKWCGAR